MGVTTFLPKHDRPIVLSSHLPLSYFSDIDRPIVLSSHLPLSYFSDRDRPIVLSSHRPLSCFLRHWSSHRPIIFSGRIVPSSHPSQEKRSSHRPFELFLRQRSSHRPIVPSPVERFLRQRSSHRPISRWAIPETHSNLGTTRDPFEFWGLPETLAWKSRAAPSIRDTMYSTRKFLRQRSSHLPLTPFCPFSENRFLLGEIFNVTWKTYQKKVCNLPTVFRDSRRVGFSGVTSVIQVLGVIVPALLSKDRPIPQPKGSSHRPISSAKGSSHLREAIVPSSHHLFWECIVPSSHWASFLRQDRPIIPIFFWSDRPIVPSTWRQIVPSQRSDRPIVPSTWTQIVPSQRSDRPIVPSPKKTIVPSSHLRPT